MQCHFSGAQPHLWPNLWDLKSESTTTLNFIYLYASTKKVYSLTSTNLWHGVWLIRFQLLSHLNPGAVLQSSFSSLYCGVSFGLMSVLWLFPLTPNPLNDHEGGPNLAFKLYKSRFNIIAPGVNFIINENVVTPVCTPPFSAWSS
jgi:hypothetical protein